MSDLILHRWRHGLLVGLAVGALGAGISPEAAAQDDAWSASQDPARRAEVVQRYKQLLEAAPSEGFVFKQLLKEVGQGQALERLIDEYREKATKSPSELKYQLILGHLLKAARRFPEAVTAYEAATTLAPNSQDAWLGYGLSLQLASRGAEALPALEKALSLVKDKDQKLDVLRDLADLAFGRNDFESADRYYQQMLALSPGDEFLRREYAQALKDKRRYDAALAQYEKLRDQAGGNVKERITAMKEIGEVYALLERYDDAIKIWRQAMGLLTAQTYQRQELEQLIIGVYRERNDLASLLSYYQSQWKSPSYEQAMILAGLHDELGQEADALKAYQLALTRDRRSVDAWLKVIRLLERRGDTAGVLKGYQELIKVEPTLPAYQFELAEIYWRQGDKRKAQATADALSKRFASDPDVQTNLADLYFRWGLREQVLDQYQKLVRLAPSDPASLIGLGEFYWQDNDQKKALETWQKILKALPDKAEAHATLGQVYADHNLITEAVAQYGEAIRLAPDEDKHYRDLALVHERARDLNKAIATWEELLRRSTRQPTRAEARGRIIQILYQQNLLRTRVAAFRADFEKSPPDLQAGYFLGESWLALKDTRSAEKVFRRLLELNPQDQEALLALHKVYNDTGEHEKNIEVLRQLAELSPLRARDYFHQIAELSLKLYEDDQAVSFAAKAVELNPSDASAHARLGRIYAQMQDLDRAIAEYRAALDLDPQAWSDYFELAELYLARDQVREADGLYRLVVRKSREESLVVRAGRKSIDLNDALGELETLEGVLLPQIAAQPTRKVYPRLLIEVYDRLTRGLIAAADFGDDTRRAEAERALGEVSRRALGPLLAALNEEDIALKLTAIRILGDLRNPNAALPLARLMEDEDGEVRVQAALAAGRLGDARIAPPMLRALGGGDKTLREVAAWALGRSGAKEAAAPLRKLMEESPDWKLRALAALGLGRLGDAGAAEVLGKRLTGAADTRAEVRVAAAWGLGALGDPRGLAPLERARKEDSDPQVRRMAVWALGNLRGPQALEALIDAWWTGSPEVREVAGKALLRVGGADGARAPYVRWEEHLGFYHPAQAKVDVAFLLEILLSDALLARSADGAEAILQGEAALSRVLSRELSGASAARLPALLHELDQRPEALSLGALTWTMPGDAAAAQKVEAAIARVGAAVAPRLRALLTHESAQVRAPAAALLGKAQDKGAAPLLIKALGDGDPEVRRRAAEGLGLLKDGAAVEPLIARLGDDSWEARAQAAASLGRLGDKRALSPLSGALGDASPWVQAEGARALGALGDTGAVPALTERLPQASPPVKVEILRALARLGGPRAEEALRPYRDDPDPAIRGAAGRL